MRGRLHINMVFCDILPGSQEGAGSGARLPPPANFPGADFTAANHERAITGLARIVHQSVIKAAGH